jgi:hypothetical protein
VRGSLEIVRGEEAEYYPCPSDKAKTETLEDVGATAC